METVTAAPALDSNNADATVRRTRSTKSGQLRKKAANVNGKKLRWESVLNESDWINACNFNGNFELTSEMSTTALATPFGNNSEPQEVRTLIQDLSLELSRFHAENTTTWQKRYADNYTFLSTRPGVSFSFSLKIFFTLDQEQAARPSKKRLFIKKNYGDQWRLIDLCWVGWIQVHKFIANHE